MSLNSLHYDTCASYQRATDSVGPGHYRIAEPSNRPSCTSCFPHDPKVRIQRTGYRPGVTPLPSYYGNKSLVDTESDLLGHEVLASKCQKPRSRLADGSDYNLEEGLFRPSDMQIEKCGLEADDTRLSNPPSTLRGTGFNRWDPLCKNPQEHPVQMLPFVNNVSSRIVAKDEHRPIVPKVQNFEKSVWPMSTTNVPSNVSIKGADMQTCFRAANFNVELPADVQARQEEIARWSREYYLK